MRNHKQFIFFIVFQSNAYNKGVIHSPVRPSNWCYFLQRCFGDFESTLPSPCYTIHPSAKLWMLSGPHHAWLFSFQLIICFIYFALFIMKGICSVYHRYASKVFTRRFYEIFWKRAKTFGMTKRSRSALRLTFDNIWVPLLMQIA